MSTMCQRIVSAGTDQDGCDDFKEQFSFRTFLLLSYRCSDFDKIGSYIHLSL